MNRNIAIKQNNRGFTLVELIIVIAIIAVLLGLIAPSLFRFLELSGRSVDEHNARVINEVLRVAHAGGDIKFPVEFADNGYRSCVVVTMNSNGLTYVASGNVLIDGKDYTGDLSGKRYGRLIELLNKYGIDTDTATLNCGNPKNGGWAYYSVILYSDGKTRIASGESDDSSAYDGKAGNKANFERHTDYWYSAKKSNIEEAIF